MNKPFLLFAENKSSENEPSESESFGNCMGLFSSKEEIEQKFDLKSFSWYEIIDNRDIMNLEEIRNFEKIVSKIIMPNNLDSAITKLIATAKISYLLG